MIGLMIADNQLSREGLLALIEKHRNGCEVRGGASNGVEALRQLEEIKPDILLTDIEIPEMDGIELTRRAKSVSPDTRSIIYSTKSDEGYVLSALRAGAKGYILKTASFEQLDAALHKVHTGGYYLSDEILQMVVDYFCQSDHRTDKRDPLTGREREVLLLVRDGLTSAEIASRLSISHRTVEAHRFRAMKKLHLRKHSELVRYFIEEPGAGHVRKT